MEIVVFGAGSLGSLLGGLLARAHEVTLVGRDPHMAAIAEDGLRIRGAIDDHVYPTAVTSARGCDADVAIVTVKAYDTDAAVTALASNRYTAVLSLQNGLTEERLAAGLAGTVLAGTATYGARLPEPGVVECTGRGRVTIGRHGGGTDAWAERVGKAFRDVGANALVATDMPRRRWEKLAVNAAINPLTALTRSPNGVLAEPPLNSIARSAARETAQTARVCGVELAADRAIEAVEAVVDATAANRSSMLQDVERGSRTEIGAICGAIVDRATERGVDVPTIELLDALVTAWEREHVSGGGAGNRMK
ncbi:ketopantoate reductase family protein [Halalkalirubrum salinum]|uniref:ketopantoate reductase family protein n=1 Tax=Halalkalirubrum salinum TaxID=2563889 RepID=UPI0010FB21C2|nr:2-dehydropantoate 2-reductase [Halalkalirubrum salinum]